MILAVDAGNTRIKWGVHDGQSWVTLNSAGHEEFGRLESDISNFPSLRRAIVSNVAGNKVRSVLQAIFAETEIDAYWVQAEAQACGIVNGYTNPAQLGCDRWAALIAAWHLKHSACIVACAGTALTVDALSSDGCFLGGYIVPGLSLMKTALAQGTAGVLQFEGRQGLFGLTTGEAVQGGVLNAMAGLVERASRTLAEAQDVSPALLFSGGDAPVLQQALSQTGEIVDNLVLQGLLLLAKEKLS